MLTAADSNIEARIQSVSVTGDIISARLVDGWTISVRNSGEEDAEVAGGNTAVITAKQRSR